MTKKIPAYLRHLPVYGGLPIPFSVMIINGVPDFRVVDHESKRKCVMNYLCAVCGKQMMPGKYWFIGGPISLEVSSIFSDPAMHKSCAKFAIEVCPFLSGRITEASTRPVPEEVGTCPLTTPNRSEKIGMRHAFSYGMVNINGYALIRVTRWLGKPIWLA